MKIIRLLPNKRIVLLVLLVALNLFSLIPAPKAAAQASNNWIDKTRIQIGADVYEDGNIWGPDATYFGAQNGNCANKITIKNLNGSPGVGELQPSIPNSFGGCTNGAASDISIGNTQDSLVNA